MILSYNHLPESIYYCLCIDRNKTLAYRLRENCSRIREITILELIDPGDLAKLGLATTKDAT